MIKPPRGILVNVSAMAASICLCMAAACGGKADGGSGVTGPTAPSQPAAVATVTVTLATPALAVGGKTTASATLHDASGLALSGRKISWMAVDTLTARVDTMGNVTALRPGVVKIRATSESVAGDADLTITPGPTASVTVTLVPAGPVTIGWSGRATAVATDSAGNVITGLSVVWTSSAPQVATVAPDGSVHASAAGAAKIIASVFNVTSSVTGEVAITVQSEVAASVAVVLSPNTAIAPTAFAQATAVAKDSSGIVVTGRPVSWSTSDSTVATITATGIVRGVGVGTAVISATVDRAIGTASVSVASPTPWQVVSYRNGGGLPTYLPVNQLVPDSIAPAVALLDAAGRPVPGASVDVAVTLGGGSISSSSVKTNANGIAIITGWRLGPALGQANNQLTATVRGASVQGNPVVFVASGAGGPAVSIRVLRGSGLIARPGRAVLTIPVVLAFDAAGNPASGIVHFAATGGGQIVGNADVDITGRYAPPGIASPVGWTMSQSSGANALIATSGTASARVSVTATPQLATTFDIAMRYDAPLSPAIAEFFNDAAFRWRQAITTPLSSYHIVAAAGACYAGSPAVDTVTTGVVVLIRVGTVPSGAAATGGDCQIRGDGMPALGVVTLESGFIAGPQDMFAEVFTHELGHILGIGTLWAARGLTTSASGGRVFFVGAHATAELVRVGGAAYSTGVMVSADGGHWNAAVMSDDLMTPSSVYPDWSLSTVTLASLTDLGFTVDLSKGDGFTVGGQPAGAFLSPSGSLQIPTRNTTSGSRKISFAGDAKIYP